MKKIIITLIFAVMALGAVAQNSFDRWVPASGTNTYSTYITGFPGSYNNTQAYVKFANTNTTTATISINGLAAQALRKWDGDSWEPLVASDIDVNTVYKIAYTGAYYTMESYGGSGGGTWGSITGTLSDQTDLQSTLDAKQATLVSGTNIKTVSGSSLLGSGDVGTIGVSYGGTGVTSSSGASSVVLRDANENITANNTLQGYATTATAAGTTTLTVSSKKIQYFTGTTTQTVLLPVTSTLALGQEYIIFNNSTGAITVQSSGANTIVAMDALSYLKVTCILTSGTGTASWDSKYFPPFPYTAVGDIVVGGTVGANGYATPSRVAIGSNGYVLTSNGTTATWSAPSGGLSGLTTNGVVIATSSTTVGTVTDLVYGSRSLTVGLNTGGTNTLLFGSSGSGFTSNTSTGEFRQNTVSSHFHTWTYAGSEIMRTSGITRNFLIGSSTNNARLYVVQGALSSAWLPSLRIDPGAHTAMTASTAFITNDFQGSTQTWGSGTIGIQSFTRFKAFTLAGTSGTNTATIAATIQVDPTTVGSNAAITNNYTIYHTGKEGYDQTITSGGTTGDQTINKPSGTVNIAASGTTVTVTNSFCTTSSTVFAIVRTNDTTAYVKNVVPGAGTFTINLGAAATAEVSIGFLVIN